MRFLVALLFIEPFLSTAFPVTSKHVIARSLSSLYATSNNDNDGSSLLLDDCVCLVTGASRGIGKGIALELGRQGATVYITGTSSSAASNLRSDLSSSAYTATAETGGPGTIEETASQVTAAGGTGIPVYCNHADDLQVQALMQQIESTHGSLDILVNNAFRLPSGGVQTLQAKFYEPGAIDAWDALHTVGVRSHFVTTSLAVPLLFKSTRKKHLPRPFVGLISSFGGLSYTFNVAYGVGKCAVDRMCKDMAVELNSMSSKSQQQQVCVTSFWPGVVATERTLLSVESGDWNDFVGIPLDNAESPQLTGRAIVAVATDANNMVKTGTVQVVAELAQEYGFVDINGQQPPSIRSLRFLLPAYAMDETMRQRIPTSWIPDWKLPFWLMASGRPPAPDEQGVKKR